MIVLLVEISTFYSLPPEEGSNHLVIRWLLDKRYPDTLSIFTAALFVFDIHALELLHDDEVVRGLFAHICGPEHSRDIACNTLHRAAASMDRPKAATWLINNNFTMNAEFSEAKGALLSVWILRKNLRLVELYLNSFDERVWTQDHTDLFLSCFPEDTTFLRIL